MVYFIMGLVFYVLASTVIINTMMMVIFERTREIGTLASLGMDSKRIVRMFIYEAGCISAIGSFIGCAIGVVLVLVLEQTGIDFTQAMEGVDFEISGMMYPMLTWPSVVYAFVTGVVVASLASIIPSRRAAKIRPVEAMLSL
jgi:putative ABC transport system permease protein